MTGALVRGGALRPACARAAAAATADGGVPLPSGPAPGRPPRHSPAVGAGAMPVGQARPQFVSDGNSRVAPVPPMPQ